APRPAARSTPGRRHAPAGRAAAGGGGRAEARPVRPPPRARADRAPGSPRRDVRTRADGTAHVSPAGDAHGGVLVLGSARASARSTLLTSSDAVLTGSHQRRESRRWSPDDRTERLGPEPRNRPRSEP